MRRDAQPTFLAAAKKEQAHWSKRARSNDTVVENYRDKLLLVHGDHTDANNDRVFLRQECHDSHERHDRRNAWHPSSIMKFFTSEVVYRPPSVLAGHIANN